MSHTNNTLCSIGKPKSISFFHTIPALGLKKYETILNVFSSGARNHSSNGANSEKPEE